ncbi:MAG TPA: response regulator transcription factor, partial [Candidatus Limnocylindrales bacterium]|nr:response regulator transcription factor [Candidatus Limnocylindrales bacterium]
MIRLLVVDDHQMFAEAVSILFRTVDDIEVCGTVSDGNAAVAAAVERDVDVVLMDVDLPGLNGIAATERLMRTRPQTRVIVFTALLDAAVADAAVRAGAVGFVSKRRAAEHLVKAVRAVSAGDEFFDGGLLRPIGTTQPPTARLTSRELEVLQGLADGLTTEDLARALFLAPRTVHAHVQSILRKTASRSKLQAVLYGLRHGLVNLSVGGGGAPTP